MPEKLKVVFFAHWIEENAENTCRFQNKIVTLHMRGVVCNARWLKGVSVAWLPELNMFYL